MLAIDHALLKDLERFRNGRPRGTAAAGRVGADESADGTDALTEGSLCQRQNGPSGKGFLEGCTENFSRSTIKADVDNPVGLSGSPAQPSPDPFFKCGRAGVLVTGGIPNLGDSTIHFIDIQSRTGGRD